MDGVRGIDVIEEDGDAEGCEPVDERGEGDAEEEGATEPALSVPALHAPPNPCTRPPGSTQPPYWGPEVGQPR